MSVLWFAGLLVAVALWLLSRVLLTGALILAGVLLLVGDRVASPSAWLACLGAVVLAGVATLLGRWRVE